MAEDSAKKKLAGTWRVLAALIAIGSSAFVLWLTFLGSAYQETYRQFLTYMFGMILALGIPSELSVSEPDRPKILIVTLASCFAVIAAFFLPELQQVVLSYVFGDAAVIGFTIFLLYMASHISPPPATTEPVKAIGEVKTDVSDQDNLRKKEIWAAFQKWVQLPIIRFRDQQDTLPLAEKPPDLAFEIDECLKHNYSTIWDDLQNLRQQYHAWKDENVPSRFTRVEYGRTIIDMRLVWSYNDSMCKKLVALHDQLAKQIHSEILDKHHSRLRC